MLHSLSSEREGTVIEVKHWARKIVVQYKSSVTVLIVHLSVSRNVVYTETIPLNS